MLKNWLSHFAKNHDHNSVHHNTAQYRSKCKRACYKHTLTVVFTAGNAYTLTFGAKVKLSFLNNLSVITG